MSKWAWWHQYSGPDEYRIRELLRGIWDLHAMYGADAPWLWRGQANSAFNLEPGMHTRIRRNSAGPGVSDLLVTDYTRRLIDAARIARLDRHDGIVLPDMALLSLLQHHGAATPLLDVSLDPIVGLYMAVVSPDPADDAIDGVLFAIRRPAKSIAPFDSRTFEDVYNGLPPDSARLYSAPDVSERLRIQRGHFVIGKYSDIDVRATIPLTLDARRPLANSWIWKRMGNRGVQGNVAQATTDVGVFRITAKFKAAIQVWLEQRSGLTRDFVYPTPWHQPHLDLFASSHRRTAAF